MVAITRQGKRMTFRTVEELIRLRYFAMGRLDDIKVIEITPYEMPTLKEYANRTRINPSCVEDYCIKSIMGIPIKETPCPTALS